MSSITRRLLLASAAATGALAAVRGIAASPARPPVARVAPVTDRYFGTAVVDDYRWMEAFPRTDEWHGWLKGQADYARAALDALPRRAELAAAVGRYLDAGDSVLATPAGDRLFVLRNQPGWDTFRYFVRDSVAGAERLLIDPAAERRAGGPPVSVDWFDPSPDGSHVAMGLGEGGSEISAAWIADVATGKRTRITPIRSKGCGWTADGTGFFYYRLRADAVPGTADYEQGGSAWLHRLGSDPASDREVLRSGEGTGFVAQEDDTPYVFGAPGSAWLVGIHYLNGSYQSQVFVASASGLASGTLAWRKVADRAAGVLRSALVGDSLYLLANGRAAKGEVVRIDLAAAQDFATGTIAMPASEAVADEMVSARDGLYVHTLRDGQGGVVRIGRDDTVATMKPPRTGAIYALAASPLVDGLWFGTDDLTLPGATYHTGADLVPRAVALGMLPPIDAARYVTERREIRARDGTGVPVELIRRRDLARDGRRPTLIQAYGAYGSILDPGFGPATLAFLDAGGIIAYAHVRGGGEKGEAWHLAGMKATKPNTWRDAIDTALALVAMGWTAPAHLAIEGTSAGGIMVGRAITERPDLFACGIGNVGCFDTIRMELTPNGKGNDAEFGTVKKADEFRGLLAMDSLRAVKPGVRYPAMLLTTGANDRRVEPWIIGKFAALLQARSTTPEPALLKVDYEAGHFSSTRPARIERAVDTYAFVLAHTG